MAQHCVFGVGHIEARTYQLLQKVIGQLTMNWQVVISPGKTGNGSITGEDSECWNTVEGERFQVITTEEDNHVRLGLVEHRAQLAHCLHGCGKLNAIFVRRVSE